MREEKTMRDTKRKRKKENLIPTHTLPALPTSPSELPAVPPDPIVIASVRVRVRVKVRIMVGVRIMIRGEKLGLE